MEKIKLEFTGQKATTHDGKKSIEVIHGDIVDFPPEVAKSKLKEGLWNKVKPSKKKDEVKK